MTCLLVEHAPLEKSLALLQQAVCPKREVLMLRKRNLWMGSLPHGF